MTHILCVEPGSGTGVTVQLIVHWKRCPHTLHSSEPTPPFLSILTVTEFSWLQNRQVNTVGRGSFWKLHVALSVIVRDMGQGDRNALGV
jgi:hypothetical protein